MENCLSPEVKLDIQIFFMYINLASESKTKVTQSLKTKKVSSWALFYNKESYSKIARRGRSFNEREKVTNSGPFRHNNLQENFIDSRFLPISDRNPSLQTITDWFCVNSRLSTVQNNGNKQFELTARILVANTNTSYQSNTKTMR